MKPGLPAPGLACLPWCLLFVLVLLTGPDLAALTAMKGNPAVRTWTSNSLGQKIQEPDARSLAGIAGQFRDWPRLLADKDAREALAALVRKDGSNDWTLLVLSGSGTYRTSLAVVDDAASSGLAIKESPPADFTVTSMELSVLVPPAGKDEAITGRALCTFSDGSKLEETWSLDQKTVQFRYDRDGKLLQEFRYREGGLVEASINAWNGTRLASTRIYDPWGLRVVNTLVYTSSGSLRGSRQDYPGKGRDQSWYARSPGKGWESWEQNQDGETRLAWDENKRLKSRTLWKDGVLKSRTDWQYQSPDSVLVLSIQVEEPQTKRKILEVYDPEGRLASRDESINSRLLGRESFVYDDDNHLILHTLDRDGMNHEWTWTWVDGVLAVEGYQENSRPVWEIRHNGDNREEDIYVQGLLVLRTWYEGRHKTKQEEYKGGKLIGSKKY